MTFKFFNILENRILGHAIFLIFPSFVKKTTCTTQVTQDQCYPELGWILLSKTLPSTWKKWNRAGLIQIPVNKELKIECCGQAHFSHSTIHGEIILNPDFLWEFIQHMLAFNSSWGKGKGATKPPWEFCILRDSRTFHQDLWGRTFWRSIPGYNPEFMELKGHRQQHLLLQNLTKLQPLLPTHWVCSKSQHPRAQPTVPKERRDKLHTTDGFTSLHPVQGRLQTLLCAWKFWDLFSRLCPSQQNSSVLLGCLFCGWFQLLSWNGLGGKGP